MIKTLIDANNQAFNLLYKVATLAFNNDLWREYCKTLRYSDK